MKLKLITFTMLLAGSFPAQAFDVYYFKSQYQKFSIKKKIDGFYYLGGQKVSLEPLSEFLPLLSGEVEGVCEQVVGDPDLKITGVKKDLSGLGKKTMKTIEFYIAEKVIKKGKECGAIGGDGIFYLPLHSSWFVGKKTISINPQSTLEIKKGDQFLIKAEKFQGSWRNSEGGIGTNWQFFNRYLESLKSFDIQARLHPGIGQGKPSLETRIDGKLYLAYLIAPNLWAMKLPGVNWLVASADWAAWKDMGPELWFDRFNPTLQKIVDSSLPTEQRLAAAQSLGEKWSPSIKRTFQMVVENPSAPAELRIDATKRLRRKPSDDNFASFMKALSVDADRELLFQLSRALKIKNPGGPSIKPEFDDDEVSAAVDKWQLWWRDFRGKLKH